MKSRASFIAVVFTLCLLSGAHQAAAAGLGAYLSGAAGNADNGSSVKHMGGGLSLDTGIDSDKLFRYRLQLGYEHIEMSPGRLSDIRDGVSSDSYFGFRLIRGDTATWWLGPEVRLGWFTGENEAGPAFGIGAATGVDIPLSHTLTLSVTGGYRNVLHIYVMDGLDERLFHLDVSLLWKAAHRQDP
jgi:hypothetical protein